MQKHTGSTEDDHVIWCLQHYQEARDWFLWSTTQLRVDGLQVFLPFLLKVFRNQLE